MKSTITCPFCFEDFKYSEAEYSCANARCAQEEDRVYAEARSLTRAVRSHVFKGPAPSVLSRLSNRIPSASCDKCGRPSSKRLCPSCHFELSHDAGLTDDHLIAIIGAKNTGKGHYFGTLVYRLEHETGMQFQFSLRQLGDETRERYPTDYEKPLFERRTTLTPTTPAAVDHKTKTPMVFRLTLRDGKRTIKAVNLSFFDSAGEDMRSLDTMSTEARYISRAAGIIFLLDPLQIPAVRQQVPSANLPEADVNSQPVHIVERLIELFERERGLAAIDRIETPVAFVLSKIDMLLPILNPGSALFRTGEHFGYFNLSDAQTVHTEIWNYLQTWMGAGFPSRVETGFETHHYFGVSSLGRPPSDQGKLESISSIRIEDPLLWLLYKFGLISGKKDKR